MINLSQDGYDTTTDMQGLEEFDLKKPSKSTKLFQIWPRYVILIASVLLNKMILLQFISSLSQHVWGFRHLLATQDFSPRIQTVHLRLFQHIWKTLQPIYKLNYEGISFLSAQQGNCHGCALGTLLLLLHVGNHSSPPRPSTHRRVCLHSPASLCQDPS